MASLNIRVGASVDRGLALAYQPLVDAANKAAAQVAAAGARGGRAVAATTKAGTSDAEKAYAKLAREAEGWQRAAVKAADKAARDEVKAAERAARDKIREAEKVTKARERENDKILRDVERTERREEAAAKHAAAARARANERDAKQSARNMDRYGGYALGATKRAVGMGLGFAKTVAGGMGVDLDMGSLITKGVDVEKRAVDVSNSGYMPGKGGANGQRQDPRELIEEVRKVAMATGNASGTTMEGLQAFVAKTGDLETGRAALFDLAKLSKATGASMSDMADAAGDVANALGDVPNKGDAIRSVMGAIAAQGKEGAVEIKDLATQMAKLGAASTQFTGGRAESIANMGALVQMTRAKGGAASSTQAATSVMSFMQSFSKGARLHKFDKYGVRVEASDGKIRNPRDIIIDALRATGGDNRKMGEMFADAGARRVSRGFETIYKDAGGGEAGIRKVQQAFDDLARATMLQTEVETSFSRAMQTSEAKAQVFNEQLGKVAMEIQGAVLPALQALAPGFVSLTSKFADWVSEQTGVKGAKQDTDNIAIETRALNAVTSLNRIFESGRTADGEIGAAGKARDELRTALARKQAQLAKEGNEEALTGEIGTFGYKTKRIANMTAEELDYAASPEGGASQAAVRYKTDREQFTRMQATIADIDTKLQEAMRRALEGSVITVRLNDPTYSPRPAISTPNGGVEPPPGAPPAPQR